MYLSLNVLATASNHGISGNAESQLMTGRADPASCSLLFVSLSLALVNQDIQESNLTPACSCARGEGRWGIRPARCCAYQLGELTMPACVPHPPLPLRLAALPITMATS